MNRCSNCNIYAQSFLMQCPLCNRELGGHERSKYDEALYPKYKNTEATKSLSKQKILLILSSVFAVFVCLIINLLTWQGIAWFVWITAFIAYGWLLVEHTMRSRYHIGAKVVTQLIGCSVILITIDFSDGKTSFALNYLLPFLCIIAIGAINGTTYKNNQIWKQYLGYQLRIVLISLIPIKLYFAGLIHVLWPSLAAAFLAAMTIFSMILFYNKQYANEMKKRFHL